MHDAPAPAQIVSSLAGVSEGPVVLRIDQEELALLTRDVPRKLLRSFPYHKIMCWGYSVDVFQFKYFTEEADVTLGPAVKAKAQLISVIMTTRKVCAHPPRPPPGSPARRGGNGTSRSPHRRRASVRALAQGDVIEKVVMRTVRTLMEKMHLDGLSDDELKMLVSQIHDFPDAALASLKQVTLTRTLDVRQAVAVVQEMAKVSPFDNVEAAVVVYGAMMNPESFHLVLDTFPEPVDRANICHRLKIEVDAAGCISGGTKSRTMSRVASDGSGDPTRRTVNRATSDPAPAVGVGLPTAATAPSDAGVAGQSTQVRLPPPA